MTIPTNAKPLTLRDHEAKALAENRLVAIVRAVRLQPEGRPAYCYAGSHKKDIGKWLYQGKRFNPPAHGDDLLWCRESWAPFCINQQTCRNSLLGHSDYCLKASPDSVKYGCVDDLGCHWHSPITMPHEACRHILRVKSVEVCRVQDLSEYQAEATGAQGVETKWLPTYIANFARNYDSTIKPADHPTLGYEANPWVFYITVERVGI